jgi:predicted DNA repair protein MutK
MPFPSANVHRRNRRKLGRAQQPAVPPVVATVSSTGTTNMRLTFDRPVVVTGNIGTTVATRTLVSQTVTSPTQVNQVWSGNVATLAYTVPAADPNVTGSQGGKLAGASGTFP